MTDALERAFFAEEISRRRGLFQSLDARVKVISVFVLLLGVSLARNLWVIGALYLLVLALAWASAIPASTLIKRVWLALPFFTGLIALPALFVTPGPPLLHVPLGLVITQTGMLSAAFLLLRVSTSLSLTMLLVLTTPWNSVLAALGVLRVPDTFVLILGMTYRYVYLLLRIANDMFLSRKSRLVGRLSTADGQKMLAAVSATLLSKSLAMSSSVYLAMQSRGFRGSVVTLKPMRMRAQDWFWIGAFVAVAASAAYLGQ